MLDECSPDLIAQAPPGVRMRLQLDREPKPGSSGVPRQGFFLGEQESRRDAHPYNDSLSPPPSKGRCHMRTTKRLKAGLALLVIGPASGVFALGVFSPQATAASATAASATSGTKTKVVTEANRSPIGEMLVNLKGQSLYTNPSGCTGSCLQAWPPLLMPKGTTKPKGAKCLATVSAAKAGRLQVTYDSQPLYTFAGDSGSSVNGNGVAGFEAAAVTPSCP